MRQSAETRFPKKHRAARRWARKLRKAERALNRSMKRIAESIGQVIYIDEAYARPPIPEINVEERP